MYTHVTTFVPSSSSLSVPPSLFFRFFSLCILFNYKGKHFVFLYPEVSNDPRVRFALHTRVTHLNDLLSVQHFRPAKRSKITSRRLTCAGNYDTVA